MSFWKSFKLAVGLAPAMLAAWVAPAFSDVSVDFEGTGVGGTGAPCCYAVTSPLTNFYAPQGLTFQGVDGPGGSILNQSGGFGFNARSGTDFLAFFTGAGTGVVETISFSSIAAGVSIWAASQQQGSFIIDAFDSNNNLLGTNSVAASTSWTQLSVNAANISSVRLTGNGLSDFAYDDLNVTSAIAPIPEPEIYAMMGVGLGLLGWVGRRRKLKAT